MNGKELAAATSEFDREMVVDRFGPMTRENRARFERARTKRGRPRQGQGAQAISVTVERRLLAETDALPRPLESRAPGSSHAASRRCWPPKADCSRSPHRDRT